MPKICLRRWNVSGVCWEPYQTLRQGIEQDPRLVQGNDMFTPVAHAGGDTYPTPKAMARLMTEVHRRPLPRTPRLGEHSAEVLESVLGLSGAALGRLFDQGLVAGPR